jgi:hypothetical protein
VAAWPQRADLNGSLGSYFNPPLTPEEREVAVVEGWIQVSTEEIEETHRQSLPELQSSNIHKSSEGNPPRGVIPYSEIG